MKQSIIVFVPTFAQSLMTGVSFARLSGNYCTLQYSDGSTETARVTAKLREQIKAYHRYQSENGPDAGEPNFFEIVSQVQDARLV